MPRCPLNGILTVFQEFSREMGGEQKNRLEDFRPGAFWDLFQLIERQNDGIPPPACNINPTFLESIMRMEAGEKQLGGIPVRAPYFLFPQFHRCACGGYDHHFIIGSHISGHFHSAIKFNADNRICPHQHCLNFQII